MIGRAAHPPPRPSPPTRREDHSAGEHFFYTHVDSSGSTRHLQRRNLVSSVLRRRCTWWHAHGTGVQERPPAHAHVRARRNRVPLLWASPVCVAARMCASLPLSPRRHRQHRPSVPMSAHCPRRQVEPQNAASALSCPSMQLRPASPPVAPWRSQQQEMTRPLPKIRRESGPKRWTTKRPKRWTAKRVQPQSLDPRRGPKRGPENAPQNATDDIVE